MGPFVPSRDRHGPRHRELQRQPARAPLLQSTPAEPPPWDPPRRRRPPARAAVQRNPSAVTSWRGSLPPPSRHEPAWKPPPSRLSGPSRPACSREAGGEAMRWGLGAGRGRRTRSPSAPPWHVVKAWEVSGKKREEGRTPCLRFAPPWRSVTPPWHAILRHRLDPPRLNELRRRRSGTPGTHVPASFGDPENWVLTSGMGSDEAGLRVQCELPGWRDIRAATFGEKIAYLPSYFAIIPLLSKSSTLECISTIIFRYNTTANQIVYARMPS